MKMHLRLLAVGAAGLALALGFLVATSATSAADDEKDVRDDVLKMADMIAKNDVDGAKKHAKTLDEDLDPEDVMSAFSLRTDKGKGGVGLGANPGEINPDGIEKKLQDLAEKKPLTPKALEKQAKALERAGYIAAAVALAVQDRPPVKDKEGDKDPADWKKWAADMHAAAREFAAAAKGKNPQGLKDAATKLNDSC
ncbi:MAG TPA: hypothetical protein VG013_06590, partial [Gemmataceae bacterium]|nr:hypothetical protein [Gemmataceae bacterium]